MLDADKAYEATLRLGVETSSGDVDGDVVASAGTGGGIGRERLEAALLRFTGRIEQVPPMHSALKRDGRPLYEYARAGIEVPRQPRAVTIRRLELRSLNGDEAVVEVDCSKGTYVRVLAIDIGRALGCGAHLSALRRTRVGPLSIADAVTLDSLERMEPGQRVAALRPADLLLQDAPRVDLDTGQAGRLRHGQRVALPQGQPRGVARARAYDPAGGLIGLAAIDDEGLMSPLRLVAQATEGPGKAEAKATGNDP